MQLLHLYKYIISNSYNNSRRWIFYFTNPPRLQVVNWILRGHKTHKVEIKEFKPMSEWTLKLRLFSNYSIICPTSYLYFLVSFTLFCSPFMKDFPLESDCPTQPSLDFVIHPVASGPALSVSSTLLCLLTWGFGDPCTLFVTSSSWYNTRLSIARHFSALVICIDAIPGNKTGVPSSWLGNEAQEMNQGSLVNIIGPCILRELPKIGQKSWRPGRNTAPEARTNRRLEI